MTNDEFAAAVRVRAAGAVLENAFLTTMASRDRDWIDAASCREGPRPPAAFADLPRRHQHEMLRFAFAAVLSSAFFISLGVLGRPLPSRSLAAPVVLADAAALARPAWLGASQSAPGRPRPRLGPAVRRPQVELTSLREAAPDGARTVPDAPKARRNVFSRFFSGVLRTVSTAAPKPDDPQF